MKRKDEVLEACKIMWIVVGAIVLAYILQSLI